MQSLHRVRERWIMRRTAVVNQIRGLLLERGITVRTGRCQLDAALPNILEDDSTSLSGTVRFLLVELKQELEQLAGHIEQAEALIQRAAQQSEACQRLDAIPGIGALTATALIAAIGNGGAFRKSREFAAWLGLVHREHSTGGKQKLLSISKRGNCYRRKLFVQGARAVLKYRDKQCSGLRQFHPCPEHQLQQRPNTFAQTKPSLSLFACTKAADHTFRVVHNTSGTAKRRASRNVGKCQ